MIICDDKKNIINLNNGSMVKDLFLKYGGEKGEKFKPSHLHLKLVGKVFRWAMFLA
jgi:hypothetical protein